MLSKNIDYFRVKTNEHTEDLRFFLDHGYHPDKIIFELEKVYPAIAQKIKLKLSPKPSKAQKKAITKIRVGSCQS